MTSSSNASLDMFSIRGDGVTTVSMNSASADALLAVASNTSFSGSVFKSRAAVPSSPGFFLIRVLCALDIYHSS